MYIFTVPRRDATAGEKAFGTAVGLAVARSRRDRGLSGSDLARIADISIDTIRSLETGRVASPGLYAVTRISLALDLSLESLAAEGIGAAKALAAEAAQTGVRRAEAAGAARVDGAP